MTIQPQAKPQHEDDAQIQLLQEQIMQDLQEANTTKKDQI